MRSLRSYIRRRRRSSRSSDLRPADGLSIFEFELLSMYSFGLPLADETNTIRYGTKSCRVVSLSYPRKATALGIHRTSREF